eukprot:364820-Chlamydomonas_euryale.AAC.5
MAETGGLSIEGRVQRKGAWDKGGGAAEQGMLARERAQGQRVGEGARTEGWEERKGPGGGGCARDRGGEGRPSKAGCVMRERQYRKRAARQEGLLHGRGRPTKEEC